MQSLRYYNGFTALFLAFRQSRGGDFSWAALALSARTG
jgi:hypothetical protein